MNNKELKVTLKLTKKKRNPVLAIGSKSISGKDEYLYSNTGSISNWFIALKYCVPSNELPPITMEVIIGRTKKGQTKLKGVEPR